MPEKSGGKADAMAVNGGTTTMGGVTYRVTPEYLANAATSTDNTASEIDTILAQVRSYVVNLEASWQGVAYNTFQTLMAEYDIYAKMLHDSLTDIAAGLRGNYVNYTESEQTNINNLQSLDASLPNGSRTIGGANLS
jgi:WXG100 family type VII secretion target